MIFPNDKYFHDSIGIYRPCKYRKNWFYNIHYKNFRILLIFPVFTGSSNYRALNFYSIRLWSLDCRYVDCSHNSDDFRSCSIMKDQHWRAVTIRIDILDIYGSMTEFFQQWRVFFNLRACVSKRADPINLPQVGFYWTFSFYHTS